jgi:hypothetical protein
MAGLWAAALRFACIVPGGGASDGTGPEGERAAAAGGRGPPRAWHAGREQVTGILEAAFVQGGWPRTSSACGRARRWLGGPAPSWPPSPLTFPPRWPPPSQPPPVWAAGEPRIPRPRQVLTVATVVYAAARPVAFVLPSNGKGAAPQAGGAVVVTATFFYLLLSLMIGMPVLAGRRNERFAPQLPRGPGPGAGSGASPRPPPGSQCTAPAGRSRSRAYRRSCAKASSPGPLAGSRSLRR